MDKFVLKYRKSIVGAMAISLVMVMSFGPILSNISAQETDDDDVDITATVQEWITFAIDDLDLELSPDLVESDGSTNIGVASADINIGTNSGSGWHLTVQGLNDGLLEDGIGDHLIDTVEGRAELTAGSDGYGVTIQDIFAQELTIPANYANDGNFVGEVPSETPAEVANYDSPHAAADVATFHVRAAAQSTTPAGDYKDTITITATTGQI